MFFHEDISDASMSTPRASAMFRWAPPFLGPTGGSKVVPFGSHMYCSVQGDEEFVSLHVCPDDGSFWEETFDFVSRKIRGLLTSDVYFSAKLGWFDTVINMRSLRRLSLDRISSGSSLDGIVKIRLLSYSLVSDIDGGSSSSCSARAWVSSISHVHMVSEIIILSLRRSKPSSSFGMASVGMRSSVSVVAWLKSTAGPSHCGSGVWETRLEPATLEC